MSKALGQVVLRNAFDLVRDKKHWTRFEFARDRNGHPCSPYDKQASVWCVLGALRKSAYDLVGERRPAEMLACRALGSEDVDWTHMWFLNDVRGHASTIKFFQKILDHRLRFGDRLLVMPQRMEEHQTPLRVAREMARVRRVFGGR